MRQLLAEPRDDLEEDPAALEAALSSGAPPDVLVPGDVAGLGGVVDTLRQYALILDAAADGLARVEVTEWRGRAADGFTDVIAPEPGRWRTAADAFIAGAAAVHAFIDSIPPARFVATDAIELWQRYLTTAGAAVEAAAIPPPPSVGPGLQVGSHIAQQQQAAAVGGPAAALAADAESLRRRAVATLAAARRAVRSAGDVAGAALATAAEAAPQARRFWESTIRPAEAIAVGHSALDLLGMVPALGILPDGVNASWYAIKDDGVNAAISAAGMLPILGEGALGARIARNVAMRPARLTRGLANPIPEVLFIAGNRSPLNVTPRPQDVTGLSTFDNLDAPIFRAGTKVQPVLTGKLKELSIWGPDGPNGHYSVKPLDDQALLAWMEARGQPLLHPYSEELISSLDHEFRIPRLGG